MNTKRLFYYTALFMVFLLSEVKAQRTYQTGLLPAVNFNYKLKGDWSLNSKLESRQRLSSGTFNMDGQADFDYVLTDFSLIAARKVGLNARASAGYLIRITDDEAIHRFIQQFAMTQKLSGLRIAHRLVTDQTFSRDELPEFRLRYRWVTEIPLNGQSADPKEFYLKVGNEYLNSLQDGSYDLEIRGIPLLGYIVDDKNRLEGGLDYRVNSFLRGNARHRFWVSLNWFVEL